MKKLLRLVGCFLATAMLFGSCAQDEETVKTPEQNVEFSFEINASDLDTKGITEAEDDGTNLPCPDPTDWNVSDYEAVVTLWPFGDESQEESFVVDLIELNDGKIVTDKLMLVNPGDQPDHKLVSLLVVEKADNTNILYSAVTEGSKYESFIDPDQLLPMVLAFGEDGLLDNFEKPCIPITLLCAVNKEAPDFGFAIWKLNFMKVICCDYVVNVPECFRSPCDSKDIVGNSELYIYKLDRKNEGMRLVYESESGYIDGEYVKGQFCFNDEGCYEDYQESFNIILIVEDGKGQEMCFSTGLTLPQLEIFLEKFAVTPVGAEGKVLHFDIYKLIQDCYCQNNERLVEGQKYFIMDGEKDDLGMFEYVGDKRPL